jgi:hypothetical protein
MKTFEFKINAGEGNEFTFFFDAQNLHTAEAIAKERTKRGHKFEYVATHPVETLQEIPQTIHSDELSSQPRAFMFECKINPDHVWMTDSDASHVYKERCSKCSRNAKNKIRTFDVLGHVHFEVEPVTYKHIFDYNNYSTNEVSA